MICPFDELLEGWVFGNPRARRWSYGKVYHYAAPFIRVADVVKNQLYLDHVNRDASFLDRNYANRILAYVAELWQHPVYLKTGNEKGQEIFLVVEP